MQRFFKRMGLAALLLVGMTGTGGAAVDVGTLHFAGDTIAAPILFHDPLNSLFDQGGLEFTIANGASGKVQLDFMATTADVTIAATLGSLSAGPQTGPISLLTPLALGPGPHGFNISALVHGGGDGGVLVKLTLTPISSALLLFGTAATVLGGIGVQRRAAKPRHTSQFPA